MIGLENKTLASASLTFTLLSDEHRPALREIVKDADTTMPAGFLPICTEAEFDAFWRNLTCYNTGVAILLRGQCIGYVHVNRYHYEAPPYDDGYNAGIGFLIDKNHRRRGYGTETLATMSTYLLERFDYLFADYFVENMASARTVAKCGYRRLDTYEMEFERLAFARKRVISTVLSR